MELRSAAAAVPPGQLPPEHRITFYDRDLTMASSVAQFLLPALGQGAAIVVATQRHRDAFGDALQGADVDVSDTVQGGRLTLLDAAETLDQLSVDGTPDRGRFHQVVGELLERASRGGGPVQVFSGMAALLYEDGRVAESIVLEGFWNEIAAVRTFDLLCAYPERLFSGGSRPFQDICAQHTAVAPRLEHDEQLRDEFNASMLHELRSPITVIAGFLDTLRRSWRELDSDEIDEFLVRTIANTERLKGLTNELLAMMRTQVGQFASQLRPVDLLAIVRRAAEEVHAATGRHIDLTATDDAAVPALADENRQLQVLHNLLTNAVKFSSPDSAITVAVARGHGCLQVRIHDEGPGIPPAAVPRLFRPFTRLDEHSSAPGTGLGLYIARQLVEAQGGRIWVESGPGDGTTFVYTVLTASEG